MTVKAVTVTKKEPAETLEMEIEIRGAKGAGKTLIAAILQDALEYHGFKSVNVINADGDMPRTRKRLPKMDLRDQRCLNTDIRIFDENKPVIKKTTVYERIKKHLV